MAKVKKVNRGVWRGVFWDRSRYRKIRAFILDLGMNCSPIIYIIAIMTFVEHSHSNPTQLDVRIGGLESIMLNVSKYLHTYICIYIHTFILYHCFISC